MAETTNYQLPPLPYAYNALEPVISEQIMTLHHKGHHQAYVDGLNKSLTAYHKAESEKDDKAVSDMIALQKEIKFFGGGHINHSFFWTILQPVGGRTAPEGELAKMIKRDFESFDEFKKNMIEAGKKLQGSGWVWLGYNKATDALEIATCSNQDPISTKGLIPVMGIDMWEHAYYLDYLNKKADYLTKIWDIFNWEAIENKFSNCL